MSILKLNEVLWEITPECDKGCSFCGSKDILDKKPLGNKLLKNVAKQLADYGVKEVTLTGGEPGILAENEPELFSDIVKILLEGGVKVKAVTYGTLVEQDVMSKIGDDFDVIGFSVNTPADVKYIEELGSSKKKYDFSRHTMITNFGTHNIWNFDELAECAEMFKCWQIQLTMGENMLNADGIKYLRSKISECDLPNNDTIIALADNLQLCHECTAGIRSCSITYNGDVVSCLSERSYGGIQKVYGSIIKESLSDIWENEFKDVRFKDCRKCCRDHIEYPDLEHEEDNKAKPPSIIIKKIDLPDGWSNRPINPQPRVVLYGAINGNDTYIYGVITGGHEIDSEGSFDEGGCSSS